MRQTPNRNDRPDLPSRAELEADPRDEFDAVTKGYADSYGRRGYIRLEEIDGPTPDVDTAGIYATDENGYTVLYRVDSDGNRFQLDRDDTLIVRNLTGATLSKGAVVYLDGSDVV